MLQHYNQSKDSLYSLKCGVASFCATYISHGLLHPFELLKIRFQSNDGRDMSQNQVPKYGGIWKALKTIRKEQGILGLFKGVNTTIFSNSLASALFFYIYETRRQSRFKNEEESKNRLRVTMISGVESGVAVTLITQPLWIIKTRLLLNLNSTKSQIRSIIDCCTKIVQENGWRGFYRGLSVNLVLCFSGALEVAIYQGAQVLYERYLTSENLFFEKAFLCGSATKISNIWSYPLTTIRTRIQQSQFIAESLQPKYKNIFQIVSKTWQNEGILGFYKGISLHIMRGLPLKGFYFYLYQSLKHLLGVGKVRSQ